MINRTEQPSCVKSQDWEPRESSCWPIESISEASFKILLQSRLILRHWTALNSAKDASGRHFSDGFKPQKARLHLQRLEATYGWDVQKTGSTAFLGHFSQLTKPTPCFKGSPVFDPSLEAVIPKPTLARGLSGCHSHPVWRVCLGLSLRSQKRKATRLGPRKKLCGWCGFYTNEKNIEKQKMVDKQKLHLKSQIHSDLWSTLAGHNIWRPLNQLSAS